MKIVFVSTQKFEPKFYEELNKSNNFEFIFIEEHLNENTISLIPQTDVVCCFVNDKITAKVIDDLKIKGVKLIALRAAGFNNIDYKYANKQNIKVCRVPKYSPFAVAEYTVSLILALNRKICIANNRVRQGNFSLNGLMGFDLVGSTVGIVGTGAIGEIFAKIMLGFGCKVLAYDLNESEECKKLGVTYTGFENLIATSDIVSLHCPLNEQTHHIINDKSINLMKNKLMLINTSRGGLINTSAVLSGLKSRKIGYLGIDVYEEEESLFFDDHSADIINDDVFCRLQTFPNVIVTGHQAFFTKQAVYNIATTTLENINKFFNDESDVYYV